MAVLKAQQATVRIGGTVSMDFADFKAEGARLLAEGKAESERLLREARAEAARLRTKALEEGKAEGLKVGHEEGFAAGRTEGEAIAREEVKVTYADRLATLTERWTEALAQWEASRDALMREARRGTIRLSLGIASRIVRRTVAADPDIAAVQLEAALELLGKTTAVTVACSGDDRELLEQAMPVLLERLGHTTEVTFTVDAALERGDIVVRMADGGVDASLATQLDRLCDALLPGSGAGGPEPLP